MKYQAKKGPLLNAKTLLLILLMSLGAGHTAQAQILIQGHITNEESNLPLPYANVFLESIMRGTATNAEGNFVMEVDSLPVHFIASHLGYKAKRLRITAADTTGRVEIILAPAPVQMAEVVVSAGSNAERLVGQAYLRLKQLSEGSQSIITRPGLAFYRQKTKTGDVYSEYAETFYQAIASPLGIYASNVKQGRFAHVAQPQKNYMITKNFAAFTQSIDPYQQQPPSKVSALLPLRENASEYFDFAIERRFLQNGRSIIEVTYQPKMDLNKQAFSGSLFIEENSRAVRQLTASIQNPHVKVIRTHSEKEQAVNQHLSFEMSFRRHLGEENVILDRMTVDVTYNHIREGEFNRPTRTESVFFFYDYENPGDFGANKVSQEQNDWAVINETEYDPAFWENNPVLAKTPVEEEIVLSFEKTGAFGRLFNEGEASNTDESR